MGHMSADESIGILETLLALGLQVGLPFALFFWGRRVAQRRPTRAWRIARWLPLAGLGILPVGILVTVALLARAFAAADYLDDAASRATVLARSIACAMNFTALGIGLSFALYLGCAIAFAYATWRAPRTT